MSAEPAIAPSEFAQAVLRAFDEAGLYTDGDVRDARGPSSTTMTKYRKVAAGAETMAEPRGDTYRAIDRAARWEGGSARNLWRRGAEPTPLMPGAKTTDESAKVRRFLEQADMDERKRARLLAVLDEPDEAPGAERAG